LRTLLVDLDAQAHATLAMGATPDHLQRTIYDVIVNPRIELQSVILPTAIQTLRLAASNVLLSGAESYLVQMYEREYVLRSRLMSVADAFDWCVIDCPPALSLLTLNAAVAATDMVIPVQTHYYAIEGLRQMLETITIVQSRFNPTLRIAGILLTLYERRTLLSRDVEQQMRDFFKGMVFQTIIHRNIRLAEAPSAGQSILTYDPRSSGAEEYLSLAQEMTYETQSRIAEECSVYI